MRYKRDREDLLEILKGHETAPTYVITPRFGRGLIEGQIYWKGNAYFKVALDKPYPFENYAKEVGKSSKERIPWEEMYQRMKGSRSSDIMPAVPDIEFLSDYDVLKYNFTGSCADCLDEDENVVKVVVSFEQLYIQANDLRTGVLVEHMEGHGNSEFITAGRIVGKGQSGRSILLETFEPITAGRLPEAVTPEDIKPGFYSSKTVAVSRDTYDAIQEMSPDLLPSGKFTEDGEEYILSDSVDLSVIKEFCDKNFPDTPLCFEGAATYFIVPIGTGGTAFHPMRAVGKNVEFYEEGFLAEEAADL